MKLQYNDSWNVPISDRVWYPIRQRVREQVHYKVFNEVMDEILYRVPDNVWNDITNNYETST